MKTFFALSILLFLSFASVARAETQPFFPAVGEEYAVLMASKDSWNPGRIVVQKWLGGSWWEVAYPLTGASGVMITKMNLDHVLTLREIPEKEKYVTKRLAEAKAKKKKIRNVGRRRGPKP